MSLAQLHRSPNTGGSGALAREFARLYPGSNVTVFDTPEVVAAAQTHFLSTQESWPSIQFCGGGTSRAGGKGVGRERVN